ncbi:NUDIX domain-containing protein [Fulvimarina manganoxydans]|uniref:NUDIX domain-containing protein n=1 Tax=Fulvimarina manganoxydans TaxID=937218 RepID=A0A1W2E4E9_9HYPH|nr:NUDIX hydrolase [Fulvimarina manganoxydans]SMD04639.1 NUDIX domain-containing protein [Fulvimarina manganoxydans]
MPLAMLNAICRRLRSQPLVDYARPDKLQSGCIPYALVDGRAVFLLITSRRSGRWVFPKGSHMDGKTPWESAAQEAYEEAGVEGVVDPDPLGSYRTVKQGLRRTQLLEVTLYPLKVDAQHETWQEMGQRHRHWAILPEVRRLLTEPEVVSLAEKLATRVERKRA